MKDSHFIIFKEITGRSRGIYIKKKIHEPTQYLRSWINYFDI